MSRSMGAISHRNGRQCIAPGSESASSETCVCRAWSVSSGWCGAEGVSTITRSLTRTSDFSDYLERDRQDEWDGLDEPRQFDAGQLVSRTLGGAIAGASAASNPRKGRSQETRQPESV